VVHNIFENRAVFGRNTPAWHQIGTVVEGAMTFEEVIKLGGLDYVVSKRQSYYKDSVASVDSECLEEGDAFVEAEDSFVTVAEWPDKAATVLGMVGKQYEVLQNVDAFKFFQPLIDSGEAVFDAAGVLGRGERVWVLAKIPDMKMAVGKDDEVELYALYTNSHDGSAAVDCAATPIRVVCQNTLSWALTKGGNRAHHRIRHTPSMGVKLEEASRVMGLVRKGYQEVADVFTAMGTKKLNKEARGAYILDVLGIDTEKEVSTRNKNILQEVSQLFQTDPLADKDMLWASYNALTAYVDHKRTTRETAKANGSAKLKSIWFGSGAQMKTRAFTKAVKLLTV